MTKSIKRWEWLTVRLSCDDKRAIASKARKARLSVSDYIRMVGINTDFSVSAVLHQQTKQPLVAARILVDDVVESTAQPAPSLKRPSVSKQSRVA